MKTAHAILLTLFLVVAVRVDAQANTPLKLLHTTPLPDSRGTSTILHLISTVIAYLLPPRYTRRSKFSI
jgi:hypothetical protein